MTDEKKLESIIGQEEAMSSLSEVEREYVTRYDLDPILFAMIRRISTKVVVDSILNPSKKEKLGMQEPIDISHELKSLNLLEMTSPMQMLEVDGKEVMYTAYAFRVPAHDSKEYIEDLIKHFEEETGRPIALYQYLVEKKGSIEIIRKVRLGLAK